MEQCIRRPLMMQQPEECQGALRYEVGVGHLDTTALEEDDEEEEGCPWEPEEEEESLEETSWRSIAGARAKEQSIWWSECLGCLHGLVLR